MKRKVVTIMAAITMLAACKTTKTAETTAVKPKSDCSPANISFATDVKSILTNNCTKCHGEDGKAGYNLLLIDDVKRCAKSGALLGTIKWESGFAKMPAHADQLDAKTIATIECWINQGMKD